MRVWVWMGVCTCMFNCVVFLSQLVCHCRRKETIPLNWQISSDSSRPWKPSPTAWKTPWIRSPCTLSSLPRRWWWLTAIPWRQRRPFSSADRALCWGGACAVSLPWDPAVYCAQGQMARYRQFPSVYEEHGYGTGVLHCCVVATTLCCLENLTIPHCGRQVKYFMWGKQILFSALVL